MNMTQIKKHFLRMSFFKSAQVEFLDDYKELINSGLDDMQICQNIIDFGNSTTKCLAGEMLMAIRNGQPITSGMSGWFSPIVLSTLAAGTKAGDIAMGLDIGISTVKDASGLTVEILNAIKYPSLMLTALVVVSGGPAYDYLLDQQNIVPLNKWGSISEMAWSLCSFCHNWQFAILSFIVILISVMAWVLPNVKNRDSVDDYFVFKQYRDLNSIAVLASVASLMRAGLGLNECIGVVSHGSSKWLGDKLKRIQLKIASGKKNYGDVFDVGLLGRQEIQRIKILSNSEDVAGVLMKCSERQRRKLKKQITTLGKLANALTMMAAGAGMAILAGGSYLIIAQSGRVVS